MNVLSITTWQILPMYKIKDKTMLSYTVHILTLKQRLPLSHVSLIFNLKM